MWHTVLYIKQILHRFSNCRITKRKESVPTVWTEKRLGRKRNAPKNLVKLISDFPKLARYIFRRIPFPAHAFFGHYHLYQESRPLSNSLPLLVQQSVHRTNHVTFRTNCLNFFLNQTDFNFFGPKDRPHLNAAEKHM